ncbi:MAG: hypothetical protein HY332_03735 [Chloroflexi bacterium]|nr:hypothetical protein [Chloroflexota bacterium]
MPAIQPDVRPVHVSDVDLEGQKDRRYHELAEKLDQGILSPKERNELRALAEEAAQLTLENARALLRHRDPAAYAAALAEEKSGLHRRARRPNDIGRQDSP